MALMSEVKVMIKMIKRPKKHNQKTRDKMTAEERARVDALVEKTNARMRPGAVYDLFIYRRKYDDQQHMLVRE